MFLLARLNQDMSITSKNDDQGSKLSSVAALVATAWGTRKEKENCNLSSHCMHVSEKQPNYWTHFSKFASAVLKLHMCCKWIFALLWVYLSESEKQLAGVAAKQVVNCERNLKQDQGRGCMWVLTRPTRVELWYSIGSYFVMYTSVKHAFWAPKGPSAYVRVTCIVQCGQYIASTVPACIFLFCLAVKCELAVQLVKLFVQVTNVVNTILMWQCFVGFDDVLSWLFCEDHHCNEHFSFYLCT